MASPFIWRIQLFGTLGLTSGERTVTRFRTQMTGSLLAYLAYHNGHSQPREVLIEQFWPDCEPKAGRGRLSLALTSLRAQLTLPDSGAPLLLAGTFTVGLNPDVFTTDVGDFQAAIKRAAYASVPSERLTWLSRATASYTEDLLVGRYESWVAPEQERLRGAFLHASAQLIRLHNEAGQVNQAIALAKRVTRVAPLHETAWCDLLRLLVDNGETSETLRATKEAQAIFERAEVRVPETILQFTRASGTTTRKIHNVEQPATALPPLSSASSLTTGTFTVLQAEGKASSLAAMALAGQQAGGHKLAGPEGSLLLAFNSGYAAVSAAVTGMHDAEDDLRIALDTGFLDISSEGARHSALPQTLSFLSAAAHTGQILCSEVTATLAWTTTGRNVGGVGASGGHRLRDLGRFRVGGDEIPSRVFQAESVSAPPTLFPPPRAAQGDTSTLPPTYTRFFGRESDLAHLSSLLAESSAGRDAPLITLVGMGGIGKTRLAIEAATRVQAVFQGRVWFVALADLQSAAHVPEVIRGALGLPQNSSIDTMEQVTDYLNVAPALLILDNMEQFVTDGTAAHIVSSFRARVPSLVCLITSRQMIGLEGERAFPVSPLPRTIACSSGNDDGNASLALFVDRARAVRPDFSVTSANFDALNRLCALLEGIPLALELAAARSGLLTPAQMLTQMEGRFALLQSRRRDLPARHRSLWTAIDSSYQHLSPDAQRFFARLSVFRGGWTLQSAQSVCDPSSEKGGLDATNDLPINAVALETLADLQESSFISVVESGEGDAPRFQMLDTVRAFAHERLREEGDEIETCQRHQVFFARLSAEAEPHLTSGGSLQQEWLQVIDAEHDNLRVALAAATPAARLDMAIDLHRFWLTRGYVAEGKNHLKNALVSASTSGEALLSNQAKAQNALGVLAWASGALTEAETYFVQCLSTYRKSDAPDTNPDCARALNNIGIVSSHVGNFERARASYEESLQIYRATGDTLRQSMVLTNLGGVLLYLKDYAAAHRVLQESLPIQRAAGDNFSVLRTLQNLAEVALYHEDIEAATNALRESVEIRRLSGDRNNLWDTLASVAVILGENNKDSEAVTLWGAAQSSLATNDAQFAPANAEVEVKWTKRLRERLPSAIFETFYTKGLAMDSEQSLAYAGENL